jgi:hypothetical protein
MNMPLVKMNKLYQKGLYSQTNYYLGLLALVKEGAEIPSVMGEVPEALLGMILDAAKRHLESSSGEAGREEAAIVEGIVAWGERCPSATAPSLEPAQKPTAKTG